MADRDYRTEIMAAVMDRDVPKLGALALELLDRVVRDEARREQNATRTRRHRGVTGRDAPSPAVTGGVSPPAVTGRDEPPTIVTPRDPALRIVTPSPTPPSLQKTSSSSSSSAREALQRRLVTSRDCDALAELLAKVPNEIAWVSELAAMLDAMPGHVHLTPEQLGEAIRDFLANGAGEQPNMRHFRTYAQRATRGLTAEPSSRRGARTNAGEQGFANARAAVEDV